MRYRHFKGDIYVVLSEPRHTETCERLVVYRRERDAFMTWARPAEMFYGYVEHEGQRVRRFAPLDQIGESPVGARDASRRARDEVSQKRQADTRLIVLTMSTLFVWFCGFLLWYT